MDGKKQRGRFTIQFNMEDPQQRAASEFLEQQGRHKAQLIACAVLAYVQNPVHQRHAGGKPTIDEAELERVLFAMIEKHPRFTEVFSSQSPRTKKTPEPDTSAKGPWTPMGDDALRAITDTLTAFQTK